MKFDHQHYVAAVRWKTAEQQALAQLKKDRGSITPLIELVPKSFRKRDGKLGDVRKSVAKVAGQLESTWQHAPAFIDVRNIMKAGIETSDADPPLLELLVQETRRSLPSRQR